MILKVDPIERVIYVEGPTSLNDLIANIELMDSDVWEDEDGDAVFGDWTLVPRNALILSLS
jgi:hypothetical protein